MRINEDFFDEQIVDAEMKERVDSAKSNVVLTVFFQSMINNKKTRMEVMDKIVTFIRRKASVLLYDVDNVFVVFSDLSMKENVSIRFYFTKTQEIRNLYKFILHITEYLLEQQRGLLSFFCETDNDEETAQITKSDLMCLLDYKEASLDRIDFFCELFAEFADMCCCNSEGAGEYARSRIFNKTKL